jgi:hypothetical protein
MTTLRPGGAETVRLPDENWSRWQAAVTRAAVKPLRRGSDKWLFPILISRPSISSMTASAIGCE